MIFGYLGMIWCVAKLAWSMFRNDATGSVIYGIATFAGAIIALNIGGVLNDTTWSIFSFSIFSAHALYSMFIAKIPWQASVYAVLSVLSAISLLGVL